MKLKYIKTQDDKIIAFSPLVDHIRFKNLSPKSAGFLYLYVINNIEYDGRFVVECVGESVGLGIKSDPEDSKLARIQFIDSEYL